MSAMRPLTCTAGIASSGSRPTNKPAPLRFTGRVFFDLREHAGSPESLLGLSYIVDFGEGSPKPLCESACEELITRQKDNPAASWVCSRCTNSIYLEDMESFLAALVEKSTNPTVKGAAAYYLARLYDSALLTRQNLAALRKHYEKAGVIKACPDVVAGLDFLGQQSPEKLAARRDELLESVVAKYADERPWTTDHTFGRLDYAFRADPRQPTLGELAEGLKYEIAHLRVGALRTDFSAKDVEGGKFQLKENRGKPVLLMFSFKGCAPCKATYPTIREIRERYSTDKLAVLGVMADESADTVHETTAAGDITWQCIWDGPSGPVAKQFKVHAYPTLILIDPEGRVAATGLKGYSVAAAVERVIGRPAVKRP